MTGETLLKEVLDFTVQPPERESRREREADKRTIKTVTKEGRLWLEVFHISRHKYTNKFMNLHRGLTFLISIDKPYLTLFHADISLAFSLSISSGSLGASLL